MRRFPLILDTTPTLHSLEAIEAAREPVGGFFSYDLGRMFESLPDAPADELNLPNVAFAPLNSRLAAGRRPALREPVAPERGSATRSETELCNKRGAERFLQNVRRAIEYIRAGDIFQVNLARRICVPVCEHPRAIFDRLHECFPAEFSAYLDFGNYQLLSNSPELFFRIERLPDGGRRIINRPIKGTRPNASGMREQLLHSEKDKAELAMIVDLQRNDLGRICEIGSVRVTEPRVIEQHPTVYHGVATIEGLLRADVSLRDILRAVFPCGSVTGCPKIRAMQIIDELEPVGRSAYCGAIGVIEPDGTMEFSVAIRTMIIRNGIAHLYAGGGIVADSTPQAELEETNVKARAMLAALGSS